MQENISVLIVDDEDVWARNLQLNLQDFGFHIAGVTNTTEGALYAFEHARFDVALLDVHMEKRNSGIELGKLLHSVYMKPFIFVTGSYDTHGRKEAAKACPSAYLTKPVNSSALFIAIQNAIHNFRNQSTPSFTDLDYGNMSSFFVKEGSDYKKVDWADIAHLSSHLGHTRVFNMADQKDYPIRSSLYNTLRYIIPAKSQQLFVQVNMTEAVQLSQILEIKEDVITTATRTFDLSEEFQDAVKNALNVPAR